MVTKCLWGLPSAKSESSLASRCTLPILNQSLDWRLFPFHCEAVKLMWKFYTADQSSWKEGIGKDGNLLSLFLKPKWNVADSRWG